MLDSKLKIKLNPELELESKISEIANKTYNFEGLEFTFKPFNLGFLSAINPLMVKIRKAQNDYTIDIDMSRVNDTKLKLREYDTAIVQNNEKLNELMEKNNDRKALEELTLRNNALKTKFVILKNYFETDFIIAEQIKLYNDLVSLATAEVLFNISNVKEVFKKILNGDIGKLDFNNEKIVLFISEVVNDFFTYMKLKKLNVL